MARSFFFFFGPQNLKIIINYENDSMHMILLIVRSFVRLLK